MSKNQNDELKDKIFFGAVLWILLIVIVFVSVLFSRSACVEEVTEPSSSDIAEVVEDVKYETTEAVYTNETYEGGYAEETECAEGFIDSYAPTEQVNSGYLDDYSSADYDISVRGAYGRLVIEDLDVNVALFLRYLGQDAQDVVDASDSAVYMDTSTYGGVQPFIGDHVNQGFGRMKKSIPQETIAYIDFGGGYKEYYICSANFRGANTGYELLDNDGNNAIYQNSGGIMMYTCNQYWQDITITYWEPINY